MKKNIFFVLAFMLPLLFACQREQKAGGNLPDEDGLVQVEFSFKTEKPRTIAVRATEAVPDGEGGIQMTVTTDNAPATREGNLSSDEEDAIENVWALQFDGNGKFIRRELVPYPEPIYGEPEMRYRLKVRLYIQDNCTVYFVANRPGIDWQSSLIAGTTTLDEFKEMTLNMYSEDEVIKDNLIPMAGHYEGPVPNTSGTVVDMTRMAAKIVFTLNYLLTQTDNSTLGITSVQLVNVPVFASYYNGAEIDPDWKYPDISDPNMMYNLTDYTAVKSLMGFATNTDHTFTWYVPENRRGINPSVTRQEDKWKGNDPSIADGGYSAAMRIVMKGWIVKYTVNVNSFSDPGIATPQAGEGDDGAPPIGGGGPTDPGGNPGRPPLGAKDITINLHPGRNNTTDYNVIRNSTYNIRASIRSIKEEPRVEAGPMVIYRYYYEDPAEDGKLIFLDADYTTALAVGETIPKDDPIPNAKKGQIPANGHTYRDGIVSDYPTTVSAEDMYNVVNIMYYRERTGPFSVEVTWLKGQTQFDHEIFGPYGKGTAIKVYDDYIMRYGFSVDGYSLTRTEIIGVSTGMEYPSSSDIPIQEDLKITLQYMRFSRSQ